MSGKKKLERATRNIKVLALPSKKVKRYAMDSNGNPIVDKKGNVVEESVQLYKIRKIK